MQAYQNSVPGTQQLNMQALNPNQINKQMKQFY